MMQLTAKFQVLFILLLTKLSAFAHTEDYKFVRIDINQGLSHNQVNCILRDSKGFMWFGTPSGLNRYDGYRFKVYRHSLQDSSSILDNLINRITEDHLGNLWINTGSGVCVFDPRTEKFSSNILFYLRKMSLPVTSFTSIIRDREGNIWVTDSTKGAFRFIVSSGKVIHLRNLPADPNSISTNNISNIVEDKHGDFWIIHRNGILEKVNGKTFKVTYRIPFFAHEFSGEKIDYTLYNDFDNDIWVFPTGQAQGIYYLNTLNNEIFHFQKDSPKYKLNTNIVRSVVQDNKGMIWVGTDHGGINIIDKKGFSTLYILSDAEDERSLSQNSIQSLYKDPSGIIWIGTFKKGISYYHENVIKFLTVKHKNSDKNSLPYDDVDCFSEDAQKNLWIGTNGGGLMYMNRGTGQYKVYTHQAGNPTSISNNIIVSLFDDSKGALWIGTYYGGLNVFSGGQFKTYRHDPHNPQSLSNDNVWRIYEDSRKNLWVGTLGGGLDLFDRDKKTFKHFKAGPNSISSNFVISFQEDYLGNLWIGTSNGIDIINPQTNRFTHLTHVAGNAESLSNNNVISMMQDSRKWMWIATREGLNFYDQNKKSFRVFRTEDGLPDNTINAILEDRSHNIWVSTPNGLSNIIITKNGEGKYSFQMQNYDQSDGLQGKEFNEFAAYRTSKGELIFGGANGFNIFDPDNFKSNLIHPKVVITDFLIFNNSIKVNEKINGRVLLKNSLPETREIVLKYKENVFTIEFAALNFIHPEKNKYSYMLEGFNTRWLDADSKIRNATYTNLNPGEYVFKVKTANSDGTWNSEEARLKIIVLPPWWRTKFAFLIYFLMIGGILLLGRRLILERERLNYRIEQEHLEAQRNHELDMMKIKFFTNISHEFRTPLTLIITPIEKIIRNTKDPDQKKQFLLIFRNAKRLLNLVNQLLDFRRMEVHELKLSLFQGDIIAFLKDISYSFSDVSEKKSIQLTFTSTIDQLEMLFDQDKVEKILFNLLSNAFKFTPEQGSVEVLVNLQTDRENPERQWMEIKVKDTGIGISEDKQDKVFERFFQNELPGNLLNQGSGIGLAITKEFVRLHGGFITLSSNPGQGSCFTVLLPVKSPSENIQESAPVTEHIQTFEKVLPVTENPLNPDKKPVVLLVEDNEEFRFYLKDNLKNNYHILEAGNGADGWKQVLSAIPDLVVSDIMMPEMNGIELCRKIKTDARTSHVPVMLLTAKNSEDEKVHGFQVGADDYITKPFNFEILESRINNLVLQRETLRKTFQRSLVVNPGDISVTSLDEKLIQKALQVVEKNISNPDFSVEELSKELGMSRVHLYKKLLSLTGKTPIEFIRVMRLKRAAQLLGKSQQNVSEIAYQVGFNNPKYFTKYFKAEFGVLPSLYEMDEKTVQMQNNEKDSDGSIAST